MEVRHARKSIADLSEPAFVTPNISPHKFFIRLCQVDDPFDYADYAADAAKHPQHELNDTFLGVTQNKFVNAESAEQDAEESRDEFLVGAR